MLVRSFKTSMLLLSAEELATPAAAIKIFLNSLQDLRDLYVARPPHPQRLFSRAHFQHPGGVYNDMVAARELLALSRGMAKEFLPSAPQKLKAARLMPLLENDLEDDPSFSLEKNFLKNLQNEKVLSHLKESARICKMLQHLFGYFPEWIPEIPLKVCAVLYPDFFLSELQVEIKEEKPSSQQKITFDELFAKLHVYEDVSIEGILKIILNLSKGEARILISQCLKELTVQLNLFAKYQTTRELGEDSDSDAEPEFSAVIKNLFNLFEAALLSKKLSVECTADILEDMMTRFRQSFYDYSPTFIHVCKILQAAFQMDIPIESANTIAQELLALGGRAAPLSIIPDDNNRLMMKINELLGDLALLVDAKKLEAIWDFLVKRECERNHESFERGNSVRIAFAKIAIREPGEMDDKKKFQDRRTKFLVDFIYELFMNDVPFLDKAQHLINFIIPHLEADERDKLIALIKSSKQLENNPTLRENFLFFIARQVYSRPLSCVLDKALHADFRDLVPIIASYAR